MAFDLTTDFRMYFPEAYGATGDGTTNDATAFTSMLSAIPSTGGAVWLSPSKTYLINTALTVSKPVSFVGAGGLGQTFNAYTPTGSTIKTTANIDLFTCSSVGVAFQNIYFYRSGTATSGSAVKLSTNGYETLIDNCCFEGFYDQVNMVQAAYCRITKTHFHNPVRYGLLINNTDNPDLGDHFISDCAFGSVTGNPAMVRYESGGGAKFVNCKWNAGSSGYGIAIDLNNSVGQTLDLLVSNCSIENFSTSAIKMRAPYAFYQVAISGNQIAGYTNTGDIIDLQGIGRIVIAGNQISKGTSGQGVKLDTCTDISLGINQYYGFSGAAYTLTSCTNVKNYDALI